MKGINILGYNYIYIEFKMGIMERIALVLKRLVLAL